MNFDMNFTDEGLNILQKASSDERMINGNNLTFQIGDPIIRKFDFQKDLVHCMIYQLIYLALLEECVTEKCHKKGNKAVIKEFLLKAIFILEM